MLIESPINYMGSKYKLLDRLIPLFPKDKKVFYDLFTGGGSVYMNVARLYETVYANDILNHLTQIHQCLNDDSFIQEAKNQSSVTRDNQDAYLLLRYAYNVYNEPQKLLALIWSCNSNMMRFNNDFKFNQTWGKRCFNSNTQKKINMYKTMDYTNVKFTSQPFHNVGILYPDDSFVYLDPPYSNTQAGYNAFWSNEDEGKLVDMLDYLIVNDVAFGISGVLNGKENKVYDFLKTKDLHVHFFEDLYQKISKKDKVNQEYYITNVENVKDSLF